MDIHHSYIKDFILPKIKSVVVVDYYEGVYGALSARKDFAYSDFLAKPRLRTKTEITWATEVFSQQPTLLAKLDGDNKAYYAVELKKRIEAIENLVNTLNEEEAGAPLAEILKKVLAYVDEQSVYCADNKVVLVNWGLIPRTANIGYGSIYRNGKFIGSWNSVKSSNNRTRLADDSHNTLEIADSVETDMTPVVEKPVYDAPEEDKEQAEQSHNQAMPYSYERQEAKDDNTYKVAKDEDRQQEQSDDDSNDINDTAEQTVAEKSDNTTPPATDYDTGKRGNRVNGESPVANSDDFVKPRQPRGNNESANWKWFFKTIATASGFFLRKLWWLLLLIAVLWALLFMTRGCQGPFSKINPYYSPLPEHPQLLPVDKDKVGVSPDNFMQIATDRLNIILEDASDDNMLKWAKAFKNAYPGAEYEVFYYNKDFNLLQIKVPSSQQKKVKEEIKNRITDIPFDVTYETVSLSSATPPNDPDFNDPSRSWYFRAIGVYDAWKQTLGSDDIIVAVVDNGFDLTHPELQGKIVGAYNVLTQTDDVRPVYIGNSENAHGTHVAATAVGNCGNGTGLSGIAPKCRLMPVQVASDDSEGYISTQAILEGVQYAINNGADVVNVSLGLCATDAIKQLSEGEQLNFISSQMKLEESMWNRVVENARRHNCILVLAAGNDNIIAGIDPQKRNPYTIRVSAVNTSLQKAVFSNYGCYPNLRREYSSVSAPGVSIYNAAPHGKYTTMDGTSMASPIVTGVVALLKSENRNLTAEQIIDILKRTGRRIDPRIGPMINVGNAIRCVSGGNDNKMGCDQIAQRLRELKQEMDSLRALCPDAGSESDTLKYEDAVRSKYGLDGVWKSTTSLVSTDDMSPIELYMEFRKQNGVLRIYNNGFVYSARLTAKTVNNKISIVQHSDATCSKNTDTFFNKYSYMCSADRFGNLQCRATSNSNTVTFNLVKVK